MYGTISITQPSRYCVTVELCDHVMKGGAGVYVLCAGTKKKEQQLRVGYRGCSPKAGTLAGDVVEQLSSQCFQAGYTNDE